VSICCSPPDSSPALRCSNGSSSGKIARTSSRDWPPLQRGIRESRREGATVIWCHNARGLEDVPNWINGRLQISPREQVRFLRRFYREDLQIATPHLRAVRQGLEQTPGTVQNALGIHRIKGAWRQATLNAKTGATTANGSRVSWLVGLLQSGGRDYVFAAAVWRADDRVDSLDGARLAVETFISSGILPRE